MVVGTGIDVIEVERVRRAASRSAFLERIFTPSERGYYTRCGEDVQTLSGIFAAKEATAKALAIGFNGIGWRDIEILHDDLGKPYVQLWNTAKARMESMGGRAIHISISHIKALAIAQAILEE